MWCFHIHFHHEDSKKQVIQQFSIDHLCDIDSKDFMELNRKCTAKKYLSFAIDTILSSDDPLRFLKNLL